MADMAVPAAAEDVPAARAALAFSKSVEGALAGRVFRRIGRMLPRTPSVRSAKSTPPRMGVLEQSPRTLGRRRSFVETAVSACGADGRRWRRHPRYRRRAAEVEATQAGRRRRRWARSIGTYKAGVARARAAGAFGRRNPPAIASPPTPSSAETRTLTERSDRRCPPMPRPQGGRCRRPACSIPASASAKGRSGLLPHSASSGPGRRLASASSALTGLGEGGSPPLMPPPTA